MAEEKQQNTMKDLDQSMIDLGVRLCEDFMQGKVINDAQSKLLDAVTNLYGAVKFNTDMTEKLAEIVCKRQNEKPPEKTNTTKSK